MNWLTKLERRFGRYTIPNLISILVGGQTSCSCRRGRAAS